MKTTHLTTLALVVLAVAGCGDPADHNDADADFATQMIPHHAQALEMAEMVPSEGTSAELVELAAAIEAAQQPEIDQLTDMLTDWGEPVPQPDASDHAAMGHGTTDAMPGMMTAEDMAALETAVGPEFERMWLEMMIEHHEGAVDMADVELADGSDDEAMDLAQEIIDAQQAEIAQMQEMLDAVS
jgi:uncharacterized protein (DUF305 family)